MSLSAGERGGKAKSLSRDHGDGCDVAQGCEGNSEARDRDMPAVGSGLSCQERTREHSVTVRTRGLGDTRRSRGSALLSFQHFVLKPPSGVAKLQKINPCTGEPWLPSSRRPFSAAPSGSPSERDTASFPATLYLEFT